MAKRKSDVLDDAGDGRHEQHSASRRKKSVTVVEDVNALPCDEFKRRYWSDYDADSTMQLNFVRDMTIGELEQCLQLVASTSRPDYEASSWGWHPTRKRKEMREDEMRYVILRESSTDDTSTAPMQGFMSFMLTHDSTPAMPVLYVYEVHLVEDARGKGLGKKLMNVARNIATQVGVDKVMLTCFLSNTAALNFYRRLGFEKDVCSPEDRRTRKKTIKVDYMIMSEHVEKPEHHSTLQAPSSITLQVLKALPPSASRPQTDASHPDSRLSDEIPMSLQQCPATLRKLHDDLKQQNLISRSLTSAISALRDLSTNSDTRKVHGSVAGCQAALQLHLKFIEESMGHARAFLNTLTTQSQIIESAIRRVDGSLAVHIKTRALVEREAALVERQREQLSQLDQPHDMQEEPTGEEQTGSPLAGEKDGEQEEEGGPPERRIKLELVDGRPGGPKFGTGELLEKWFKTTIQAGAFRDIIKTEPVED
jgi:ribosomal protein S18 acetylase RimI-like enzyme